MTMPNKNFKKVLSKPKKINTSAKGARQDRAIMAYLQARGFTCIRSAASKGLADVIAIGQGHIYLIQNKNFSISDRAKMKLESEMRERIKPDYYFAKSVCLDSNWPIELPIRLGLLE